MFAATLELIAAGMFAAALLHTLAAPWIERLGHRWPKHAGAWHLRGEVEVIFGLWAMVQVVVMALLAGGERALRQAESRQYAEPLFVLVMMVVAALARRMPMREETSQVWLGLTAVPLLGLLITEPAAMTIAALMLAPRLFALAVPERLKYLALGVFVNVSIGGTLRLCRAAGADGGRHMAMGFGLHAGHLRLEGGAGGAGQRQRGHPAAPPSPAHGRQPRPKPRRRPAGPRPKPCPVGCC